MASRHQRGAGRRVAWLGAAAVGVALVAVVGAACPACAAPAGHLFPLRLPAGGAHPLVLAVTGEAGGADAPLRKEASLSGYLVYGLMALTVAWEILTTTGLAKEVVRRSTEPAPRHRR